MVFGACAAYSSLLAVIATACMLASAHLSKESKGVQ
jgi:hypothetical protein